MERLEKIANAAVGSDNENFYQQITNAGIEFKTSAEYDDFLFGLIDLSEGERAEKITQKAKEQQELAAYFFNKYCLS